MTEQKSDFRFVVKPFHQCAWCSDSIRGGESFTVTFPDKERAVFHIECLDRYREVMEPRTAQ
jgi:hypothetical protein